MNRANMRLTKKQLTKAVWAVLSLAGLLVTLTLLEQSPFAEAESSGFAGGDGSANNPYLIETAEQLDKVRNYLDMNDIHFMLNAHIDLGERYGEDGWQPIGSESDPFAGTFDGNGYTISGLRIETTENYVGLFGYTAEKAEIINLTLVDVKITGNDYVGALVGYNQGTIENSHVIGEGKVKGNGNNIGGLVGYNKGKIENTLSRVTVEGEGKENVGGLVGRNEKGTIINAYATGDVTGDGDNVGGLVGRNENDGTIENSAASGAVEGKGSSVGGLVGSSYEGTIEKAFATGNVIGNTNVGGLVGNLLGNNSSITNAYATGDVTGGNSATGGLVGVSQFGKITNTYATGVVEGSYIVGGLVGQISNGGKLSNSFALNPSITDKNAARKNAARIVGNLYGDHNITLSNNYALEKMEVNGEPVTGGQHDDNNGADISEDDAKTDNPYENPYENQNWDFDNIWELTPGKYPTLKENKGQKYLLAVAPISGKAGSTEGFGLHDAGKDVTLKAYPNPGYFVNWIIDGQEASTDDSFVFTMPAEDVIIVANFIKPYTLTVEVNDANAGTATGGGTYEFQKSVTLEAIPNPGYRFVNWTIDGQKVSTDDSFEYTMPAEDVIIVANFEPIPSGGGDDGEDEEPPVNPIDEPMEPIPSDGGDDGGDEESSVYPMIIKLTIPITDGQRVIMYLPLTRIKHADGTVTDELTLTPAQGAELAEKLSQAGQSTLQIVLPHGQVQISQVRITLSQEALQALGEVQVNVQLVTSKGSLFIPYEQLTGLNEDLTIRIIPLKDGQAKLETSERARQSTLLQQLASGLSVELVGEPVIIESNLQNRPVTVTLPLNFSASGNEGETDWLKDLLIYIRHSNDQEELVAPEVIEQGEGKAGLQFEVEHFSTFAILHVEGWREGAHHPSYIKGYADGSFKPEQPVTRAQMAAMLARLLGYDEGQWASSSPFADVPAEHWAAGAIALVKAHGLMVGNQEGKFRPEAPITRAEMAVIAARYKRLPLPTLQESAAAFTDTKGHWAIREIAAIKTAGIVDGYADGTFRPNAMLKRAQAVKILNRLLGRGPLYNVPAPTFRDVPEDHWAFPEIEEAARTHRYLPQSNGGERYEGSGM